MSLNVLKKGEIAILQSTYIPVLETTGSVQRVIAFAIDISKKMLEESNTTDRINAIRKSQAVIYFSLDGIILDANKNFLDALGYRLEDIKGKHHSIFVDPAFASSMEYHTFWDRLNRGEYVAGTYKHRNSKGQDIWLEASYNPIIDSHGKALHVTQYAVDVTKRIAEDAGRLAWLN